MAELDFADVNEFHPLTNAALYSQRSSVIVLRAHNGTREDFVYGNECQLVYGCPAITNVGHYGYIQAALDPYAQGQSFARTLLKYRPQGLRKQDWIIGDDEEGTGDRVDPWLNGAASILLPSSQQEWEYSGYYFWKANIKSTIHTRWFAAYGQLYYPPLSSVWQYADNILYPGVAGPCDSSRFPGTLAQFQTLIGVNLNPPPVTPAGAGTVIFNPPVVFEPCVSKLEWPGGGELWLTARGGVYAFGGAPYLGSAEGKAYFAGRTAQQIVFRNTGVVAGRTNGYCIIDTANEKYNY